jgi:hypothetical protein
MRSVVHFVSENSAFRMLVSGLSSCDANVMSDRGLYYFVSALLSGYDTISIKPSGNAFECAYG